MSDVEDTFCIICGRDPCVWDIDKSTVRDLSNASYLGDKIKGSLVESKQAHAARRFYMYQVYTGIVYGVIGT